MWTLLGEDLDAGARLQLLIDLAAAQTPTLAPPLARLSKNAACRSRAEDAGVSQAEMVRRILDEALGIDLGAEQRVAAVDATAGILADAPDWPAWLERVRGAHRRLRELGM